VKRLVLVTLYFGGSISEGNMSICILDLTVICCYFIVNAWCKVVSYKIQTRQAM